MGIYLILFNLYFLIIIGVIFLVPEKKIVFELKRESIKKEKKEELSTINHSSFFPPPLKNFCEEKIEFLKEEDKKFCFQEPKIKKEKRLIEIDLTNNIALLYEQEKLIKIFHLLYQAPEEKWFQTPTGYFRVGIKKEKHLSSLFTVILPYSIQIYEDFFIHGIPRYQDGTEVDSDFTGGCLRFEDEIIKKIYKFLQPNDQIVIYKTFDDLEIKPRFYPPVNLKEYWIRQRFNNPFRETRKYSGTENLKFDYYQHTGIDFAPYSNTKDFSVYAIYNGKIIKIQPNDGKDHGLGNTVIIEHYIDNEKIYSLYAHLSFIEENIREGMNVKKGEKIGKLGSSGYGCQNHWRIGPDGCNKNLAFDTHLHFEIKKAPSLENPFLGKICQKQNGEPKFCYGYTPDYPQKYGYLNPITYLFQKK